jgi:superfamily I DNA and RNA helicase
MILSEEQQHILDEVRDGHNVMVDAVAGTGKTTLILSIARELPDKRILQLTYNASLRKDVKETILKQELTNINVHTYHSLAKRYYLSTGYTDTEIRRLLFKDTVPKETIADVDLLVLDECQDMTLLYFQLMVKFMKDYNKPVQLLILGDYMQGLYEFKGADIRFLTLADIIWSNFVLLRTNVFKKCTMKMSFRITNQMRSFVNNVMLGGPRMNSCRDAENVTYIRNSRYNLCKVVFAEINKLFEQGVKPCEIFILGNSVKGSNSNIRNLENTLVEKDIPCHIPLLENENLDERVIDGKIVFSTFHCVKGRQRKYVFVVGFDNSYLKYYARGLPRDICPNALYVSATRATHGLYLLETAGYSNNRPLKFLKKNHIEMKQCDYITFKGNHQSIFPDDDEQEEQFANLIKKHIITPTELVRFISESVIENISPIIDRIFIKESFDCLIC